MDGKYLASNIAPLKVIGDGKVFIEINNLLNSNRFENFELAAYTILGNEDRIVSVKCLFRKISSITDYGVLFFRTFDYYKGTKNVTDVLKSTGEYGIGFGDFDLYYFTELRDFYHQHITASEVAQ
jgi:hypothetical protein